MWGEKSSLGGARWVVWGAQLAALRHTHMVEWPLSLLIEGNRLRKVRTGQGWPTSCSTHCLNNLLIPLQDLSLVANKQHLSNPVFGFPSKRPKNKYPKMTCQHRCAQAHLLPNRSFTRDIFRKTHGDVGGFSKASKECLSSL